MRILVSPSGLIKKQTLTNECEYRENVYTITHSYKESVVVYNFFNDCLVFFSKEEYENIMLDKNNTFLIENWFFVPKNFDEYSLAQKIRSKISSTKTPTFEKISAYTIMTTTDCNAQCYYCYEFGRKKIHMPEKVANDLADYIIKKYNGKSVKLRWFGGEPLYNEKVIDIIVNKLKENDINYSSSMISNAYLVDETKIEKYKKEWKLTNIQITLDGIVEEYNTIKNYIYNNDVNPFEKVVKNIESLINNEIAVSIRLNLSSLNKESLVSLIDYCSEKFKGNKYFSMYVHNIFDEEKSEDEDFLKSIYKDLEDVKKHISSKFGYRSGKIKRKLTNKVCMANSGSSLVVSPLGELGLCEHYSESEFIGSIYKEGFDEKVINSWNERREEYEGLCKNCPLFPSCYRLKKCENSFCNKFKRYNEIKNYRLILNKIIQHEIKK